MNTLNYLVIQKDNEYLLDGYVFQGDYVTLTVSGTGVCYFLAPRNIKSDVSFEYKDKLLMTIKNPNGIVLGGDKLPKGDQTSYTIWYDDKKPEIVLNIISSENYIRDMGLINLI